MPAEILSLDMDWFNLYTSPRPKIHEFFIDLKKHCTLPSSVDIVPEHQYLYPWSVKLLGGLTYKRINIINIDEHHDFYSLRGVDFENGKEEVGCWNFFAFMVHEGLMSRYTWVSNSSKKSLSYSRRELERALDAGSKRIKHFKHHTYVRGWEDVFKIVHGRRFDGFLIVKSPGYTERRRAVYCAVNEALKEVLPKMKVRRYQCRLTFKKYRVHHRATKLFPLV